MGRGPSGACTLPRGRAMGLGGRTAVSETNHRSRAVLVALLVAFLWATSWVLIKWGIRDVAPLTFAGLRYSLASLCLSPILLARRAELRSTTARGWGALVALGLVFYALTQGGQFLALA